MMCPASFDNILSKFKAGTKQAADQMGKAAKAAKLKMEIMTLTGEKTRHLQTIGTKTYELYCQHNSIDGGALVERVRNEFSQIERIEEKVRELENEIADLQAYTPQAEVTDITDHNEGDKGKGNASDS